MTPDERLDAHLDSVLRASGSALRHYTMEGTRAALRAAMRAAIAEEACFAVSDSSFRWVPVSERVPEDGQTVLALWHGPSCEPNGCAETLTYYAHDSDVDGRNAWTNAWGEVADEPTHWKPWEPPK